MKCKFIKKQAFLAQFYSRIIVTHNKCNGSKRNGKLALYGFDQQRLIWYVSRLWDKVFS